MSLLQEAFLNPAFSVQYDLSVFLKYHTASERLSVCVSFGAQAPSEMYAHSHTPVHLSQVWDGSNIVE